MWLFYYFNFERNYDVLEVKESKNYEVKESMFVEQNINFNKNRAESKIENHSHIFRETNLLLQLI